MGNVLKRYNGTSWEAVGGAVLGVNDSYSTSTAQAYSCDFINGTVLYQNSAGSGSEITLNDNYTNYKRIEVYYGFYHDGTSSFRYGVTSSTIDLSVSDLIMMSYTLNLSVSSYQREYQVWRFNSNNKLTPVYQQAIYDGQDAGAGGTKIAKIIGYKY